MNSALPGFVPAKGQKVYFGRSHGEQTLGEVVKVNRVKVKVKQLESRGTLKDHPVGTIWTVPLTLLTPAPADAQPVGGTWAQDSGGAFYTPPKAPPKRAESAIMQDIAQCYGDLSPENLTCDGELPMAQVRKRASQLRSKLKSLFQEIGRVVSEEETWSQ